MQRELVLPRAPKRIVSLVPSITELLHDLDLQDEVVGLTKFCIHPKAWCKTKTNVGGTKKINFDRMAELQPDLIIGNKEENTKNDIEQLEKEYNVCMTDVNTFDEALEMITLLGQCCDRKTQSNNLVTRLIKLKKAANIDRKRSAIYLIWKDPFYAVGQNTFINDMMELAGFENLVLEARYPEITLDRINELQPNLLLLSTEPYPFANKYLKKMKTKLKNTTPTLVDGEMFSWYGSRLVLSFQYFNQLKSDLESK